MKIEKVYKTSKGTFWSKVDAEKKMHRVKTYGSRPGDPVEYEPVQEAFVLMDEHNNIFELTKVQPWAID